MQCASSVCSKQSLLESAYKTPSPRFDCRGCAFCSLLQSAVLLFCFEQPNLFGSRNKRKKTIWAPSMSSNQPGDTPAPLSETTAYRNPRGEVTSKARLGMVALWAPQFQVCQGQGLRFPLTFTKLVLRGKRTDAPHVLRWNTPMSSSGLVMFPFFDFMDVGHMLPFSPEHGSIHQGGIHFTSLIPLCQTIA